MMKFLVFLFVAAGFCQNLLANVEYDTAEKISEAIEKGNAHKVLGLTRVEAKDFEKVRRVLKEATRKIDVKFKVLNDKGIYETPEARLYRAYGELKSHLKKYRDKSIKRADRGTSTSQVFNVPAIYGAFQERVELAAGELTAEKGFDIQKVNSRFEEYAKEPGVLTESGFHRELSSNPSSFLWFIELWKKSPENRKFLKDLLLKNYSLFTNSPYYSLMLEVSMEELFREGLDVSAKEAKEFMAFLFGHRMIFISKVKSTNDISIWLKPILERAGIEGKEAESFLKDNLRTYLENVSAFKLYAKRYNQQADGRVHLHTEVIVPDSVGARMMAKGFLGSFSSKEEGARNFDLFKTTYYHRRSALFQEYQRQVLEKSEHFQMNEKLVSNWLRFKEPIGRVCFKLFQ